MSTFHDPIALLRADLTAALAAAGTPMPVGIVPPPRADGHPVTHYVLLSLVGGALRDDVLDDCTVVVEVHGDVGEDDIVAATADTIRDILRTLPDRDPRVEDTEENSRPVPLKDPDTGAPSSRQTVYITLATESLY